MHLEIYSWAGKILFYLGAVKTNIGHLETASGIAGLIKVVLCLQKRKIPPNINFKKMNPEINLGNVPLIMANEQIDLDQDRDAKIYGGISSFGFSGTLAHVVLEGIEPVERPKYEYPFKNRTFCHSMDDVLDESIMKSKDITASIIAFECYFLHLIFDMKELEKSDDVDGKYTEGLNQKQMGFTGDHEECIYGANSFG